jgi:hypothetical protein
MIIIIIIIKLTLEQATKPQKLYSFFKLGTRCGWWSTPRPGRFTPGKETRCPLYKRLGGPRARLDAPTGIQSTDRPDRSELL